MGGGGNRARSPAAGDKTWALHDLARQPRVDGAYLMLRVLPPGLARLAYRRLHREDPRVSLVARLP